MLVEPETCTDENSLITSKNRYIVMELLKPPISKNVIISSTSQQKLSTTGNLVQISNITNEIGIFGVLVRFGENNFIQNLFEIKLILNKI